MGRSIDRVAAAAEAAGLEVEIRRMPATTRTAEQAARACGCAPGQIVKSLVFARADTGGLVLLLIPGDARADLDAAGRAVGAALRRADAETVRRVTGFAIGGVAPLGHKTPIPVWIDPALLSRGTVWAAAGAPDALFAVAAADLARVTGARPLP